MPILYLGLALIILLICLATLIYVAYVDKRNTSYGSIPLNVDFLEKRIKIFSDNKIKLSLFPFMTNQKLNEGKWITWEDFSRLFDEKTQKVFIKSIKEHNQSKDTEMKLFTKRIASGKKYEIKFVIQKLSKNNAVATMSWKQIKRFKQLNVHYVENIAEIPLKDPFFSLCFTLSENNVFKKDVFLSYLFSKLNTSPQFKYFVYKKRDTISIRCYCSNENTLNSFYNHLIKQLDNNYITKICIGGILIPYNKRITSWPNEEFKEIDYKKYLIAKNKKVFEIGTEDLGQEAIDNFENSYKKILGLLSKKLIKYETKPIYEYLNKLSSSQFVYPELENNDTDTNYILWNTNLKYMYLNDVFNFKNENKDVINLIKIDDYNFAYLSESNIAELNRQNHMDMRIVVTINNNANIDAIYKKALLLKTKNIETIIGVKAMTENVLTLLEKLNSKYVVITESLTANLDRIDSFVNVTNIISHVKTKQLKLVIENLDINKQGYKIRKQINEFFYTKEEK